VNDQKFVKLPLIRLPAKTNAKLAASASLFATVNVKHAEVLTTLLFWSVQFTKL